MKTTDSENNHNAFSPGARIEFRVPARKLVSIMLDASDEEIDAASRFFSTGEKADRIRAYLLFYGSKIVKDGKEGLSSLPSQPVPGLGMSLGNGFLLTMDRDRNITIFLDGQRIGIMDGVSPSILSFFIETIMYHCR